MNSIPVSSNIFAKTDSIKQISMQWHSTEKKKKTSEKWSVEIGVRVE